MSPVSRQGKHVIKNRANAKVAWKYLFLKYNLTYFKLMTVFDNLIISGSDKKIKNNIMYMVLIFTGGLKAGHGHGSAAVPLEVQPNSTLKMRCSKRVLICRLSLNKNKTKEEKRKGRRRSR